MTKIKDSYILITGGASGIGRQMALKMAKEGGKIIIWDINDQAMAKVADEIKNSNGWVKTYHCDVSDRRTIYRVAGEILNQFGSIDVLINNAGRVSGKPFLETPDEMIEQTFSLNLLSYFWTIKAFLPRMIEENKGHIVTISSAAGIVGVYKLADYNASKFAVFGLDESLRVEFRRKKLKIRTTIVCPYYIDTGLFKGVKTRFPLLLPILKEEKVAENIVRAVKKDRPRLVMPLIVYSVWLLRIFPVWFFDFVSNFLGINNTMDDFTGRGEKR